MRELLDPKRPVIIGFGSWNLPGLHLQFQSGDDQVKGLILIKLKDLLIPKEAIAGTVECGLLDCIVSEAANPGTSDLLALSSIQTIASCLKAKCARDQLIKLDIFTLMSHPSPNRAIRLASCNLICSLLEYPDLVWECTHLDHYLERSLYQETDDACREICMRIVERLIGRGDVSKFSDMHALLKADNSSDATLAAALDVMSAVGAISDIGKDYMMPSFCHVARLLGKTGALGMSAWKFMASVTILKVARFKFVELNCTNDLVTFFLHASSEVQDNPIKEATMRYALLTLNTISEYPVARQQLKPLLSMIKPTDKFSQKAFAQVAWEP